jgi:SAM-dependent methyltransferase
VAVAGEPAFREAADVYAEPALEWQTRLFGTHLDPGFEKATVVLAGRAAHYGLQEGGLLLDVASALGGPARFIARRFAATVICVDLSRRMHAALVRGGQGGRIGAKLLAGTCSRRTPPPCVGGLRGSVEPGRLLPHGESHGPGGSGEGSATGSDLCLHGFYREIGAE